MGVKRKFWHIYLINQLCNYNKPEYLIQENVIILCVIACSINNKKIIPMILTIKYIYDMFSLNNKVMAR